MSRGLELNSRDTDLSQALAHYAQGLILEEEQGEYSVETLEHFEKAFELDPERHELYSKVATIHLYRNSPGKAVAVLEQSCKNNPRSLQPRLDLAWVCKETGRLDEAIEHYTKALKLGPSQPVIYLSLAKLFFQQNKDSQAMDILERGLKKIGDETPNLLLTFCYVKGRQFINSEETSRSIPLFGLLARQTPSNRQEFYHVLGELYAGLDQEEEAVRNFILATKEDPPKSNSFIQLAFIYLKTDSLKAIETLRDANRMLPNKPEILASLGYLYNLDKQFEKAISIFESIKQNAATIKEQKLMPNFYLFYGSASERAGHIEKAESIFEEGLQLFPDTHEMLNYLAYMWAEKDMKLGKALEYVGAALEHDPDNGAYIDTLGWIYYKQKEYDKALEQIQKANELIQNDPTIIEHLGDTFNALHDKKKAVSYWKRSFLLAPENEIVMKKLKAHQVNIDELLKRGEEESKVKSDTGKSKLDN